MSRRSSKRLAFALIAALLTVGALEAGLRLVGFEYESFFECPDWWTRCSTNPIFVGDPLLFWRLKPNANSDLNIESRATQYVNSQGFRDYETPVEKAPNELRVISLGDSCTFGDGVANWEAYPEVLEELVRKADPDRPVNVINAGVPGYTSYQIEQYLKTELLKFHPDVVTVYVGFNDNIPASGGVPDKLINKGGDEAEALQRALRPLRLYQFVNKIVSGIRNKDADLGPSRPLPEGVTYESRVPVDDYIQSLCDINKFGKEHDFTTVVMTLPHIFEKQPHRNREIRKAARECEIPMVELWDVMKAAQAEGVGLYNSDGGHPNAFGHRVIAKALFAELQKLGKIPAGPVPELPPIDVDAGPEPDEFPAENAAQF
ncbi:SGNH/GDSL hydrolase family protein [bacterium]|nr:SGNH/GDSL hydrolase family protein [bacterium]